MSLILLAWGGSTRSGTSSTDPTIEEWSNSLALVGPGGAFGITQAMVDEAAAAVHTWFTSTNAGIASTERLDWVKFNKYDLDTGHQITDPTMQHEYLSPDAGALGPTNPVTTAYRVSIDNGTRNRRTRGGFYSPRVARVVEANGRWNSTNTVNYLDAAVALITAINSMTTISVSVGVWSRRDKSVTPITRVRISNVPDNISRRKSEMDPAYVVHEF